MRFLFLFLLSFVLLNANSQGLTHGPVVGGVTYSLAKMYVRTQGVQPVIIELSESPGFQSIFKSYNATTNASVDSSVILLLDSLEAFTKYYYRAYVNGVLDSQSTGFFKTFPLLGEKGNYTWVTGSCMETPGTSTFSSIVNRQPDLFIHTGDFLYPDYQIPGDYRLDDALLSQAYKDKYNWPGMKDVLRNMAISYVYDNHDGPGARDNIAYTGSYLDVNNEVVNYINYEPVPAGAVQKCKEAYQHYFPTYPLADSSEGLYHKYSYGNVDVFFLDVRNCGTQVDSSFYFDTATNLWVFDPTRPGVTMLGEKQMQWLLDELAASQADWKFIAGGVMFNKKFRKIINVAMLVQKLRVSISTETGTGFRLAYSMAYNWAGFPLEQNRLLKFLDDNEIYDVITVTGHTHTNVMDNGTNAGLPEINAGPLASYGLDLTYYLDSLMQVVGFGAARDSLWNGGGQGVDNQNFNSGFGMIYIYEDDSVVMKIVDEFNTEVSSMTLLHSSKKVGVPTRYAPEPCVLENVYPVPASDIINVSLCTEYRPKPEDRVSIVDVTGKATHFYPFTTNHSNTVFSIPTGYIPNGNYVLIYDYGDNISSKPIQILK